MVTHLTTNPTVHCLYMAERTGSLILSVLWSYVADLAVPPTLYVAVDEHSSVQACSMARLDRELFTESTGLVASRQRQSRR